MPAMESPATTLTDSQIQSFEQDGFLVVPQLIPPDYVRQMQRITQRDLTSREGDIEYEADLNYPGAPESRESEGGRTIRRLRQAVTRDPVFCRLLKEPFVLERIRQLLGPQIVMPMVHHNCIMTKHPQYSSDTGWHQDTRYWSFETPELVNLWIALGEENMNNGCLRVLPGTHREPVRREQLDDLLFLRTDLECNLPLLQTAVSVELQPGDALFFHARCFHAATRNYTDATKCSVVFTFRSFDNKPIPGTRSAELPELLL
ncbi:MAG: phytanoyl-CoA dioxygenase family protein, partial [Planctomycetaceae bacterium]|nr:phytanoyl-CoA dioxygenase family protein [Planctomycetaceae bacterium]